MVNATDATYPPYEYVAPDGHTVVGMDPDIMEAIGKQLNLTISQKNSSFATIIPGLSDGKYDIGMSSFIDTAARQKQVDFVTYAHGASGFYIKTGAGKSYNGLSSLCGAKVAVENGTVQQASAQAQAKKCTSTGKPTVTTLAFADQNSANLALSSGRADIGFADAGLISYVVKQSNGAFAATGSPLPDEAETAIALPKGNGMTKAIQAALQQMIKSGEYMKILKKWGTQSEAVTTSMINVAKG
ncbi:MAG: ABC transporter substrate-binding protein [Actinomycetota bacterium]|nr:ABC transporter substrate-binding protein [Actinomycetota bacterium]